MSSSFFWCPERSESVTVDESACTSAMTRDMLSRDTSFSTWSITASIFSAYSVTPSRWYRSPKCSTWMIPSSSGNSTSASRLMNCDSWYESMWTRVRPLGIVSAVSEDFMSTSGVR